MQVITEAELLTRIRSFLERHDMAPTTFGRKATGEPQLISSLEGGRSPSLKIVQRVMAFMDESDSKLRANPPPLELTSPPGEVEIELPFVQAPVNPTGASSPTSSPTNARPQPSAASGSSPTSSCSADEAEAA